MAILSLPLAWWLLALLALGASILCAVLLVAARTPFLAHGAGFFRTALVLHVDFAVVVWFLAVAAGLWLKAFPVAGGSSSRLANGGILLAGFGALAMLLSPLDRSALPILANYVPVLDSPPYYLGLAAFLFGIALTGLAVLTSLSRAQVLGDLWRWPMLGAIAAFIAACVIFMLAWPGANGEVSLDGRLWGGGHVLQIVHTLMLMSAWLYLGRQALDRVAFGRGWLFVLIGSELLAVVVDLVIAVVLPVDSPAYRLGFTSVMRWLTWPAPVFLAAALLLGFARLIREQGLKSAELHLIMSIALFLLGCVVGAAIRGETTAVPAHYHGTVGAVTLAYMLWARRRIDEVGLLGRPGWLWRWQPVIYGFGISLMVGGLAWAGQFGVPRKAPHIETNVTGAMQHLAMGLAGSGGLLATAGAAIFVLWILRAISKRRTG